VTSLQSLSLRGGSGPFRVRGSPGVRLAFRAVRSAPRLRGSDDLRSSSVTGRLAFPVPSSTLPVSRRVLEVFRSLRDARCYPCVVPSRLWFPSRAPLSCGPALTGLLSWDSSERTLSRASLVPPLHRRGLYASTPARRCRRASDSRCQLEFPFRPRGFSPPRRFPPRGDLRACCIPLPILGFVVFPAIARIPRDVSCTPRRTASPHRFQ